MLKEKTASDGSLMADLLSFVPYKPTQGLITRRATMIVIWATVSLAVWRLFYFLDYAETTRYAICGGLGAIGIWIGYRLVNWQPYADFLIAVEAEMNKVSWPSRGELIRSSVVVIAMLLSLAIVVGVLDFLWESALWSVGVWRISSVLKRILGL